MFNTALEEQLLNSLNRIQYGSIQISLPNGSTRNFSADNPGPSADFTIHDYRTLKLLVLKGTIGFAESYQKGWWDSENLTNLNLFALKNFESLERYFYGGFLSRLVSRIAYLFTPNTLNGSKKNINAHYDLGNEFYKLWLDPTMTYSSAIFADESESLIAAQHRKYDRIIERLNSSGTLLEIGCGWGGFVERALEKRDYTIKGLTISKAQFTYANQLLQGNAKIVFEDYRTQEGIYDQIVSIEMFEAVGQKYWSAYFNQLKSLLAKNGKAVLQTITIKDQYFDAYRKAGDPIRTFIFPGGLLPSKERFLQASGRAGLVVTDQFSFGKDYALTLKHWLNRFERNKENLNALGFDEKFVRLWRFYFCYCIAGFLTDRTDVVQMELQHAS